ncbi:MAG: patatin-like phospholipase family protein [Chloroflexi bacterium]|nr:patatin-like phospholipase family protein [Chloroflexota bacterium]
MFTFVLSGGGSRGALQAGALKALIEAEYRPEMVVGTSIGAMNAAYLALYGPNERSIEALCQTWREAAQDPILSSNQAWVTARVFLHMPDRQYYYRLRDFLVSHDIDPELRFGDLEHCRLIVVATDLNHKSAALFGADPNDKVLDALLASAAIPPWIPPIESGDRLLTDGGFVSNLPIEPAIRQGATEIVALDLADERGLALAGRGLANIVIKVASTAAARQAYLEMALAEAARVPVRRIHLQAEEFTPVWDFSHTAEHIELGYEKTRAAIAEWKADGALAPWWRWWTPELWFERLKRVVDQRRAS